ncbi:MAG: inositol monophosphatase family protein [Bdellovibrionota bacterium]
MTDPKLIEKVGIQATERAASILLRHHKNRAFTVQYKGDVNLVTDADLEAEKAVIETIREAFPSHVILSEENKNSHNESLDGPVWIIDPLDGTTNFSHGVPHFAVSIGFRENSQNQFGIVYQPVTHEMFIAHRGQGSFLNGEKINVSKTKEINRSLIVTGFAYDRRDSVQNNLSEFCLIEMSCQDVRRFGAATLDLCYVACGRFDGYWEHKLSAWDIAAGMLIVEEAGGTVTDFAGKRIEDLWCGELTASNGIIHSSMNALIQKAQKTPLSVK